MVRTLIRNGIILEGEDLVPSKGYVYIKDDVIGYVGKGEVSEEHEVAELHINAKDKIVLPGLISPATWISLYPFRVLLTSGLLKPHEVVQVLSRDDVYSASILAGYELLKHGVTTVGVLDQHSLDQVVRALYDIGLRVLVLVDPYVNNLEYYVKEWDDKDGRVKVYVLVESPVDARRYAEDFGKDRVISKPGKMIAGATIYIDPPTVVSPNQTVITALALDKWAKGCGLALGVSLKYSMLDLALTLANKHNIGFKEALKHSSLITARAIGLDRVGSLSKGYKADLIVLNTSEPPGWPPNPVDHEVYYKYVMLLSGKVETVIVDGETILDMGEPLNVGYEKIYKAKEKLSSIVEEYYERLRHRQ